MGFTAGCVSHRNFLQEPFGRTCPLLPLLPKSELIEKCMLDSVAHGSHMVENDVVFFTVAKWLSLHLQVAIVLGRGS